MRAGLLKLSQDDKQHCVPAQLSCPSLKGPPTSRMRSHIPVILALRRLRQGDQQFETDLAYEARVCSETISKIKQRNNKTASVDLRMVCWVLCLCAMGKASKDVTSKGSLSTSNAFMSHICPLLEYTFPLRPTI